MEAAGRVTAGAQQEAAAARAETQTAQQEAAAAWMATLSAEQEAAAAWLAEHTALQEEAAARAAAHTAQQEEAAARAETQTAQQEAAAARTAEHTAQQDAAAAWAEVQTAWQEAAAARTAEHTAQQDAAAARAEVQTALQDAAAARAEAHTAQQDAAAARAEVQTAWQEAAAARTAEHTAKQAAAAARTAQHTALRDAAAARAEAHTAQQTGITASVLKLPLALLLACTAPFLLFLLAVLAGRCCPALGQGLEALVAALTWKQRDMLVTLTAKSGEVANLEVALDASGIPTMPHHVTAAASSGSLTCLLFLARRKGSVVWGPVLQAAARAGHTHICRWILARCDQLEESMQEAGEAGEAFEAWEQRKVVLAAVRGGHSNLAERLLKAMSSPELPLDGGFSDGDGGACDMLADLDEQAAEQDEIEDELPYMGRHAPEPWDRGTSRQHRDLCLKALKGCPLAIAQRFYAKDVTPMGPVGPMGPGPPPGWTPDYLEAALRKALASRTPDWAAKVELVLSLGAQLEAESAYTAAARLPGALAAERFAWLKARGCALPPHSKAVLTAALSGRDAAGLAWLLAEDAKGLSGPHMLHAAGCRLDWPELALAAAEGGSVEALEWALEGAMAAAAEPADCLTPKLFAAAVRSGSLEAVWVLWRLGCAMSVDAWTAAAAAGAVPAVELLAEWGCPMPVRCWQGLGHTCAARRRAESMTHVPDRTYVPPCIDPAGERRALRVPALAQVRAARGAFSYRLPLMRALRAAGLAFGPVDKFHSGYPVSTEAKPLLEWLAAEGCPLDWARMEQQARRRRREEGWARGGEELEAWVQALGLGAAAVV
ncbi:hypothetical protein HYH03_009218 [Edaphochlamys debaryana]|uniref:Uncharacterized protein n=1 Tax=Edaphochlamys debaryana TaxID=47281 RepID=A0A835XYI8_9CHLO|nr:hypothetical protein HYH03_009218 [Edaphochlamys debaryana]|eukprot:KAG2492556.1 hypothetical protein HYH03_009218 [Edaphochlamys debaryana]